MTEIASNPTILRLQRHGQAERFENLKELAARSVGETLLIFTMRHSGNEPDIGSREWRIGRVLSEGLTTDPSNGSAHLHLGLETGEEGYLFVRKKTLAQPAYFRTFNGAMPVVTNGKPELAVIGGSSLAGTIYDSQTSLADREHSQEELALFAAVNLTDIHATIASEL